MDNIFANKKKKDILTMVPKFEIYLYLNFREINENRF